MQKGQTYLTGSGCEDDVVVNNGDGKSDLLTVLKLQDVCISDIVIGSIHGKEKVVMDVGVFTSNLGLSRLGVLFACRPQTILIF